MAVLLNNHFISEQSILFKSLTLVIVVIEVLSALHRTHYMYITLVSPSSLMDPGICIYCTHLTDPMVDHNSDSSCIGGNELIVFYSV
jgi:hypothetical protein